MKLMSIRTPVRGTASAKQPRQHFWIWMTTATPG